MGVVEAWHIVSVYMMSLWCMAWLARGPPSHAHGPGRRMTQENLSFGLPWRQPPAARMLMLLLLLLLDPLP